MKNISAIATAAGILLLAACDGTYSTEATDRQRVEASSNVAREQVYSYEIANIEHRRLLFGKPGAIGYVVLMNAAGQPIMYTTVSGKCTSSGKRLTRPQELVNGDSGEWDGDFVFDAVGEDGAYGKSEDYIYCWTPDGRYLQWSGDYLYSDKPFDLRIQPLVVDHSTKTTSQQ